MLRRTEHQEEAPSSAHESTETHFHQSTQELIDKRRSSLQKRVEQALKQVNLSLDDMIHTSDDLQSKRINDENIDALLDEQLTKIQKQLESIPRLSRSQFMDMPKEQREEYIKVIERLAAQSSIAMKIQRDRQLTSGNRRLVDTVDRTATKPTMNAAQKTNAYENVPPSSVYAQSAFTDVSDHRNAHYTVQAIEIAAKREHELRMKRLEEIRTSIIQRNFHAIWLDDIEKSKVGKYASFVSVKRLLHHVKYKNIDELNKQKGIQFMRKNCPLVTMVAKLASDHSSVSDLDTTEMSVEEKTSLFDWISHAAVLINDWSSKITDGIYYPLDECLLYSYFYSDEKYQDFNRAEEESPKMRKLREDLVHARKEVELFNEDITQKWKQLDNMERLRYYIRSEYLSQFDNIVKKGREIGLDDEKIIQLFTTQDDNSQFFSAEFNSTKNLELIPLKSVSHELEFGVHVYSYELAQKLNIPEQVLVQYVPHSLLERIHGAKKGYKKAVEELRGILGLKTMVAEFIEYWKEVSVFDDRWYPKDSQHHDSNAQLKPTSDNTDAQPNESVQTEKNDNDTLKQTTSPEERTQPTKKTTTTLPIRQTATTTQVNKDKKQQKSNNRGSNKAAARPPTSTAVVTPTTATTTTTTTPRGRIQSMSTSRL